MGVVDSSDFLYYLISPSLTIFFLASMIDYLSQNVCLSNIFIKLVNLSLSKKCLSLSSAISLNYSIIAFSLKLGSFGSISSISSIFGYNIVTVH